MRHIESLGNAYDKLGLIKQTGLVAAAGLCLILAARFGPELVVLTDTARNSRIAEQIFTNQGDQIKDFLQEYVPAVNPKDIAVVPQEVEIDPTGIRTFSQRMQIHKVAELESESIGTILGSYDSNGVASSMAFSTDRKSVGNPEINLALDSIIATEGFDSTKLAGLYEQQLKRIFNLPGNLVCDSEIRELYFGDRTQTHPALSISCVGQKDDWTVRAYMASDGTISMNKANPKINSSCGIG